MIDLPILRQFLHGAAPANWLAVPRKPRWLIIGTHICDNWRYKARFRRGKVQEAVGATHKDWPIAKSLAYIDRVFDDYLAYGGIRAGALEGKTVLEIGPGDNLGLALKLLAAGASRVCCVDKYYSIRDTRQEEDVYRVLREQCDGAAQLRFDAAITLANGVVLNPGKLRYIYGVGIEEAERLFPPAGFDIVLSRAVLMEIHRTDAGMGAMTRLLRPGGMMIHKIAPCHDYGIFSGNGYHPLEYLTIPDWLYERMACDSGKPNRMLIPHYRAALAALGCSAQFHITSVLDSGAQEFPPETFRLERGIHYSDETLAMIREIRPRLCRRFRGLQDEELMVRGAVLVARKPG